MGVGLLRLVQLKIKRRAQAPAAAADTHNGAAPPLPTRDYPLFETFVSRSPKVEALSMNPDGHTSSILHGTLSSVVHRQMLELAQDVKKELGI